MDLFQEIGTGKMKSSGMEAVQENLCEYWLLPRKKRKSWKIAIEIYMSSK